MKKFQVNLETENFATYFVVEVDNQNIGTVIHESPSLYRDYIGARLDMKRLFYSCKLKFVEDIEGSEDFSVTGVYQEGSPVNLLQSLLINALNNE